MSKTIRSLFLVAVYFLSVSLQARSLDPVEEWQNTNLSVDALASTISDQNCKVNLRHYFGCIDALKTLLSFSQEADLDLVPQNAPADSFQSVVQNFSEVKIVKRQAAVSDGLSQKDLILKFKNDREKNDTLWKQQKVVQFSNIFKNVRALVPPEKTRAAGAYALNAYLSNAVDAHSYIMSFDAMTNNSQANKDFVGIGIQAAPHPSGVLIQSVFEGGPAEEAGLKSRDVITAVNDQNLTGLKLESAIALILGEEGTAISIDFIRDQKVIKKTLKRRKISVPNVKVKLLESAELNAKDLYIKINSFMPENTCVLVEEALKVNSAAKKVIVDLRNNGGGRVDLVACLAALFLKPSVTVMTYQDPVTQVTKGGVVAPVVVHSEKRPLVVLVNSNSASASEIFAGVIQDYSRGFVVGERTFGKGTMQSMAQSQDFLNTIVAFTEARYHLPSGRSPQLVGIVPDFAVFESEGESGGALREEDLYRFPISQGSPIQKPTHPLMSSVEACVTGLSGRAPALAPSNEVDRQLEVAQRVLRCQAPVLNKNLTRL